MRSLIAILALLLGLIAGQTAGGLDVSVQHISVPSMENSSHLADAATMHAVGTEVAAADCAGCPDEDEHPQPCVGASTSCSAGLVGLIHSEKPDVRIDVLASTNLLAAERVVSGLARGVDTPPPRQAT